MQKRKTIQKVLCTLMTFLIGITSIAPTVFANETSDLRNLAAGIGYTFSTGPRKTWPDKDGKELTDGIYASKVFTDAAWQGHHINDDPSKTRTVVFDLGEAKSVKSIKANFLHDPNTGIRVPLHTTIEVSNDNQKWYPLSKVLTKKTLGYEYMATQPFFWEGNKDGVPAQKDMNMVYTQYIRISFVIDSPWVFLDEVEIMGTDGKAQTAWEVPNQDNSNNTAPTHSIVLTKPNELGLKNLASGINYELSIPSRSNYPDSGRELTDGNYGTNSYSSQEWQGHYQADGLERKVIFDLGEPKSIKKISADFLHNPSKGIKFPEKVIIEVSNDKKNWGELSEVLTKKSLSYEYDAIQEYYWNGTEDGIPTMPITANMVYTQYVRLRFSIDAPMVFIDEVEIWGADGKLDEAVILPPGEDDPSQGLPEGADYMRCGEQTGNVNNLILLYNHVNRVWTKNDILPYLGYVNQEGQIKDWFFDSVLYLGLKTPGGKTFDTSTKSPSNMSDWEWYLNRTFKEKGDMSELNEAAKETATALKETNRKVKVFLMVPYPSPVQTNFGDVLGNGTVLNFNHEEIGGANALENRKQAVKWYIDKAMAQWRSHSYTNLEIVGFYWLGETITDGIENDQELVKYTSNLVHSYHLKHLWIPYYKASGRSKWKDFGFDAAIIQPNYYFDKYAKDTRLRDTSVFARKYGMGIEMECDEKIKKNDQEGEMLRAKYNQYLNDGLIYKYSGNVFKGYYQGGTTLLECKKSNIKEIRDIYDNTYQFVSKSNPPTPIPTPLPSNPSTPISEEKPQVSSINVTEGTEKGTEIESAEGKTFDPSTRFIVNKSDIQNLRNLAKLPEGLKLVEAYDISMMLNDMKIQPDGKVNVRLKLSDELKGKKDLAIAFIDDNGNITEIESIISDGYICFITDHFSTYAIVEKPSETSIDNSSQQSSNPKTGDHNNVTIIFILLIVTLGALTIKRKITD